MGATFLEQSLREPRAAGQVGIVPYVTVGYPSVETSLDLVLAFEEAGAHAVELGVPFSDPLADGTTVQRASFHALGHGVTLLQCLESAAELRRRGLRVPIVPMSYYNPLLAAGLDHVAETAAAAGVDGFIVPDLPPEEAGPLQDVCARHDLALVPMLAPTSTEERVRQACAMARGFIYCVSVTGVTGARATLGEEAADLVSRARQWTDLPLVVGFGVSRREHVEAAGRYADAVIVASALLDAVGAAPGRELETARRYLRELQPGVPSHGGEA